MPPISSPTRKLLTLSMLKGVGPAALKKAANLPNFDILSIQSIGNIIPQIGKSSSDSSIIEDALARTEDQIEQAISFGASIISSVDCEYPALLTKTKDDPVILFIRGKLHDKPDDAVAIIGTREPTSHGILITTRITQFFTDNGWSIISGLALGCDAIAHQAAINAGGHTVAVMAHGLHTIAPSKHRKLADDILASGGAIVSEYPFGHGVQRQQFVKRDRIQAGLAKGVIMMQSDLIGGSLHASRAALDYGRWLAVPYPTTKDLESKQPKVQANLLIADGIDTDRANLLRCPLSSLNNIFILRGREDYAQLAKIDRDGIDIHSDLAEPPLPPATEQLDLLTKVETEQDATATFPENSKLTGALDIRAGSRIYSICARYDRCKLVTKHLDCDQLPTGTHAPPQETSDIDSIRYLINENLQKISKALRASQNSPHHLKNDRSYQNCLESVILLILDYTTKIRKATYQANNTIGVSLKIDFIRSIADTVRSIAERLEDPELSDIHVDLDQWIESLNDPQ